MFKLKKVIASTIAAVSAVCIMSISAFAYSNTGTVRVNTYLNVRSSASTSAAIIGKLYNGSKVSITGGTYGWYKISYNGKTAWVSSSYISLPESNASRISTVIDTAKNALGTTYVWGGASPTTGFDCSGLTMYAYEKVGVFLPHRAADQAMLGTWVSQSNLKQGDLVFFDTDGGKNNVTHVGIYIGNGNFISATSGSTKKVTTSSLSNSYWANAYMSARRYIQ